MRGLLIVNPNATTTDAATREVLTAALSSVLDLEVVTTTHRGHAGELGEDATRRELDVVVTLGGDGTVHEVVNGMLFDGPGPHTPALATIPGGSANVFARATGLPNTVVQATGAILTALRDNRQRVISLGRANGKWFTTNAGAGLDAEVIHSMDEQRSRGKKATPSRYVRTALKGFFAETDRKTPSITIVPDNQPPVDHVFLAIVQNCSPWTYLGGMSVNACPRASFESGLDVMGARTMNVLPSLWITGRILRSASSDLRSDSAFLAHDLHRFALVMSRPTPFQIDGEALGEVDHVTLESVPGALRIVDGSAGR